MGEAQNVYYLLFICISDRTVAPSERQRWQRGEQQPVPESAANSQFVFLLTTYCIYL